MIRVVGDQSKLPMPTVDWEGKPPEKLRLLFAPGSPFDKNRRWLDDHLEELKKVLVDKWVCVAGEELFVAETEKAAIATARTAHPEETGPMVTRYMLPPFTSNQHAI